MRSTGDKICPKCIFDTIDIFRNQTQFVLEKFNVGNPRNIDAAPVRYKRAILKMEKITVGRSHNNILLQLVFE